MKKHLLFKFLLTFTLALFTVGWVNGQEIIDNWTIDGGSISYAKETTEVHGGSNSIEITWTSTSNQYLNSEEFAVTAGQSLEISTWVYDNDAAGRARLCVQYTGASSYYGDYSSDGTSWEELTYSGTVPTGATAAYIQIRFYDVSPFDGDATVLVDDVSYIMNSGSNVVTNPGFENWSVQPIISNITMDPGVAQSTDAVTISADVDPNTTTVNSVDMNWGTTSGSLGNNVTMTNTSGNTWTADSDIPAQTEGTTIYYEIEVTYNTSETITSDEQNYTVSAVTEVADIATLRAGAQDGTIYKLTGEVVLTFDAGGSRNQKFIEDGTAAILIDDASGIITTSYNEGDGITGIFGTLSEYNGITQFVPEADPGDATTGYVITPQEITISEFNTNYTDYESELIKFVNVNFNGADGTGTFNDDTDYTLGDGTNTTTFRYGWAYSLDYQGNTIPHESIDVTLVGIGARYNTTPQFYCRNAADMTIPDYIVITSPADNTTFDTESEVTVDFVTYNQTDNLKLQVWVDDPGVWEDQETGIDPASGTVSTTVPANAPEASTYKLRLIDETDSDPISNEVPFAINDISGPVLDPTTPYDPVDGTTDVPRNQVLTINFDELVQAGTGNILIKKTADDTEVASYDVTSATEVDITNMTVTITNGSEWPNYTDLYVEMAAGVIVDMQGNNDYSLTKGEWNFVTADEVAPSPTFDPANLATNVSRNGDLTITFDEPIYAIGGAAFNNTSIDALISLSEGTTSGGTSVAFDATINGTYDVITINPTTDFDGLTDYYYAISNLFEDAAGNQGSAAEATFETVDDSAPLVTITPANGSTDIDRDTTIAITFDKAVRNIDDSAVENADLAAMITLKETDGSGADVAFTATIDANKDSISVVPDATLKAGQVYYIAISADLESDADVAIAATNATFTTIDDEAPIATFDPASAETDVVISSTIIITMNEAILNTDASAIDDTNVDALITLKDTDGSGTNISFDATIDASKEVITITPDADFDYNQNVYVALAAVEDDAGNESTIQTATFTTIANDDATLSDLTVDGTTVTGFDAATYTYTYTVPFGTTTVPTVAATENDPDANAVVTQATNVDGTEAERTATVVVTAEDGTTELTYEVVFEEGPEGDLFFSEYIEGSSYNKALEIYNGTGSDIDLHNYVIRSNHNGGDWEDVYVFPEGEILTSGDVYVLAHADADEAILALADSAFADPYTEGGSIVANFNGDDARALCKVNGSDTTIIDVIGLVNDDPGDGWDVAGTSTATKDYTLIRKSNITIGNTDWSASAGTDADDSEWIVNEKDDFSDLGTHGPKSGTDILTYSFAEQTGAADIDDVNHTVDIEVSFSADISNLIATFTLSSGATATVGATEQVSGTTANDFSSPVTYTITAEDASTQDWVVTVTQATTASSEKDITGFSVEGIIGEAIITSGDATVDATVEYGTDITSLKPTFEISNLATFVTDTSVAKDFTNAQDYIVEAEDGTQKTWTVTIAEKAPTDVSDIASLRALYSETNENLYRITGEVTFTYATAPYFYIQDATAAILIYDHATYGVISTAYSIGDNVQNLVGVFDTFGENMQFALVEDPGAAVSTGNTIDAQLVTIPTLAANYDDYDAELIMLEDVTFSETGTFAAGENYTLNNGSDQVAMRTNFSDADYIGEDIPTETLDVTALAGIYNGDIQVYPRSQSDMVVVTTGITNPDGIVSMNIFPNPSNGLFTLEMNASKAGSFNVQIINIQGQVVYNKEVNQDGFYKDQIDISNEASGIYYIRINDGKNTKVSKIMIQ